MAVFQVIRQLPGLSRVRDTCQAIAMLDAVLSPDWTDRYFSYAADWSPGETMASMRNGNGDEYSIVFSAAGAWARGFAHESPITPYRSSGPLALWPGLVDTVPAVFDSAVHEPAFCEADGTLLATVCFWRQVTDTEWHCGDVVLPSIQPPVLASGRASGPASGPTDPDGADELFEVLADGRPEAYQEFAQDYYEQDIDFTAVQHAYAMRPLTQEIVDLLNPDLTLADLEPDRKQIGYPAPPDDPLTAKPSRPPWAWPSWLI